MTLAAELKPLTDEDNNLLEKVRTGLPIMADLSRSDLLLYHSLDADRAVVLAHALPHSVSPVHTHDQTGNIVARRDFPLLARVLAGQREGGATIEGQPGEPVQKEIWPLRGKSGAAVAALCIETTIVEIQRHHKRSQVFRSVLHDLQQMLVRGELDGTETLSPFGEHDGILFVDAEGQIRYVSGVAENLYRKLGHAESLLRHSITSLGTNETAYFSAVENCRCFELETYEGQLIWIRKAIPVRANPSRLPLPATNEQSGLKGILLTVSDVTDSRRREQELRVKAAMIQEIHHRVKNNLQTIASLLRIQSRRIQDPEARMLLDEGVNRILSVAVVHEFLSHDEGSVISIREVAQRIVNHTINGILDPEKGIHLALRGGGFSLVAQQATACALVINELVQNAVEHGYTDRKGGTIVVNLVEEDGQAVIKIADDGEGLPPDFDLDKSASLGLGLKIVQTLVREDLKGTFELTDSITNSRGVRAVVRFPRLPIPKE